MINIQNQSYWFMCMTCHLIMPYKCMKFHGNVLYADRQTNRQTYKPLTICFPFRENSKLMLQSDEVYKGQVV